MFFSSAPECVGPPIRTQQATCVHQPLLGLLQSSESLVLITLCNWHHLDNSVVIGVQSLPRVLVGELTRALYIVMSDSLCLSGEEPYHSEHYSLCILRGSYTFAHVLQRGLVETTLFDTSRKSRVTFTIVLLFACTLSNLL